MMVKLAYAEEEQVPRREVYFLRTESDTCNQNLILQHLKLHSYSSTT